ncbi:MAG: hypothetical protein GC145_10275 [Caulobacter sp.]|nr:hypothetical protein [Caulobacter sp.]
MAMQGVILAFIARIEVWRLSGEPAALECLLVEIGAHCQAAGDLAAFLDALSLVAALADDGTDEGRETTRVYRRLARRLRQNPGAEPGRQTLRSSESDSPRRLR